MPRFQCAFLASLGEAIHAIRYDRRAVRSKAKFVYCTIGLSISGKRFNLKMLTTNDSPTQSSPSSFRNGCLWMVATMLVSGILLFLNAIFSVSLYFGIVSQLPDSEDSWKVWLENSSVSQAVMFVSPILLLAVQWMLIDALFDHMNSRNSSERH
jgi:hypothetical protein